MGGRGEKKERRKEERVVICKYMYMYMYMYLLYRMSERQKVCLQ